MSPLQDIYLVSSIIGFAYIAGSAALGSLHIQSGAGHSGLQGHGGSHGNIGHGGAGHSGAARGGLLGHSAPGHGGASHAGAGHGTAPAGAGHGAAPAGAGHGAASGGAGHGAAPGGAGHGAASAGSGHGAAPGGAGHGAAPGGAGHGGTPNAHTPATGSHGPGSHGDSKPFSAAGTQTSGHKSPLMHDDGVHSHGTHHDLSQSSNFVIDNGAVPPLYLKLIDILSPTKLSFFLFLFGAIGIFSMKVLPGFLSLAPAAVLGWFLSNAFFNVLGTFLMRIGSSTNFSKDSLIGSIGQLTLSIDNGGLGEALITKSGSRHSGPAKPYKEGESIPKMARIIIVDIKDGVFLVQPFDDHDL